jgi:hypothetical protein
MPRCLIALLALLGFVGPLAVVTAQSAMADDMSDMMHCEMQEPPLATISESDDCCNEGCTMPSCCRLSAVWRIVDPAHAITPVVVTATFGFTALPDAPRSAHTLGIERPPKV